MINKSIKVLTLLSFIAFILIFIAYRSNEIDPIASLGPDSDFSIPSIYSNSLYVKDSFHSDKMMSSSKSILVISSKTKIEDTLPKQTQLKIMDSNELMLMGSSKSAIIFNKPLIFDSSLYIPKPDKE